MSPSPDSLTPVPDAAWQRLAGRRVLFGHQSVGANILEGVRRLAVSHPEMRIQVLKPDTASTAPGGIVDLMVGSNGNPRSKTESFAAAVDRGLAGADGIAFHKYCYVDFSGGSDPARIFSEYQALMNQLQGRHIGVRFLHMTVPLNVDEGLGKTIVKRLLGRTSGRDLNRKRHEFNQLMRQAYPGAVLDLAALESVGPDGRPAGFRMDGVQVPSLAPEWTYDGGHLNEAGQDRVARHLMHELAGHAA